MISLFRSIVIEFRELDVSDAQLRKFGFLIGGIILVIFGFFDFVLGKPLHFLVPMIGFVFIVLTLLQPRLLLWSYYVWMGIAIVLGSIISPVFLALLFFGFLTPIALLKRVFSRHPINTSDTYWIPRTESQDPKHMEELF